MKVPLVEILVEHLHTAREHAEIALNVRKGRPVQRTHMSIAALEN